MSRGMAVLAGILLLGAGCHHDRSAPAQDVVRVVPGPSSAYAGIVVSVQGRTAEVPNDLRSRLAPLLATRRLSSPGPPSDYGLDRPQAALIYRTRAGATVQVDIGATNFDHHFVYARRTGAGPFYLVPADTLRPILALAGLELPPPG
jgi:hypothetical protein